MNRRSIGACVTLVLALARCTVDRPNPPSELSAFAVEVAGVFALSGPNRVPLNVVSTCAKRYGGQEHVPLAARGTLECRYSIPRADVEVEIVAAAIGLSGKPLLSFNGPVSFRIVPGELGGTMRTRWENAVDGQINARIRIVHPYGKARIWVEDSPPRYPLDGGGLEEGSEELPVEPSQRTYATGVSKELYFDDQSLQALQIPSSFDNRSSPFVGEFVSIGKSPESGEVLTESCEADPLRDAQEARMVVTGTDSFGFFVTDVAACRLPEWLSDDTGQSQVRTAEPNEPCLQALPDGGTIALEVDAPANDAGVGQCAVSQKSCHQRAECHGYLPGTFASMYVYNNNYPEGLNEGDLIYSLSGSVQEFTSTTQMVFPAWSVAEHVRLLPQDQWNKWLKLVPPVEINARICGMDNLPEMYITDPSCGHNRRNLKLESLESALVKIRNVRFPNHFESCDLNANGSVPFFCETRDPQGNWIWSSCAPGEAEDDRRERECHQSCVLAMGKNQGQICTEKTTFAGFGQFVVELQPFGAGFTGLDDSLSKRFQVVDVTPISAKSISGFKVGTDAVVSCSVGVHLRAGASGVAASSTDPVIDAGQVHQYTVKTGETSLSLLAESSPGQCSISSNVHARINVVTKDALPELNINCDIDDEDEAAAMQCQNLRGATFDVTGHLRHVQPGRPRWLMIPRDPEDLCCHPAKGLACPTPIHECSQ